MAEDSGKTKITQRDIARMTGVSQGIVSLVLRRAPMSERISDDTKRRILQIAHRHNYPVSAGSFQPVKMRNIIGIIVKKETSQFFQDLITLLNDQLESLGYRCIVSRVDLEGPDPQLEKFLDQIISYNYAGMICIGHFSPRLPDLVPKKLEHYPNVVFLNMPRGVAQAAYVKIDFASGVAEAVQCLRETGRQRIALGVNDMISDAAKGRFAGYCAGLLAAGLPMRPELCWVAEDHHLRAWEGDDLEPAIIAMADSMLKNYAPDAIIVANDQWAVVLMRYLKKRGLRIPEDIAVVGYGNFEAYCTSCDPMLSSISHGNEAIASALARTADDLICGRTNLQALAAAPVEIKTFLVRRESC
ncbi:LacI family DNA-binding transcriptional regulator [Victivallis sp. Marseille-Q1083]|uniref:LacI family DNA-binding transcriptional regulator n=1 Tax=Victivallis sp. Marseille-Q1083 TaxID=2717288 RepID=UPI00158F1ACE|nr:LacI family DNA-binding transcriptional regulator [Victivallis sp. Marseille-Q1083]